MSKLRLRGLRVGAEKELGMDAGLYASPRTYMLASASSIWGLQWSQEGSLAALQSFWSTSGCHV